MKPTFTPIVGDIGFIATDPGVADAAFFSPPYKARDGFDWPLMHCTGGLLSDALRPGALAFMVFGQLSEGFRRPVDAAQAIVYGAKRLLADPAREGLQHWQTVIWLKSVAIGEETHGHFQPINSPSILNYCWEYIFVFWKPDGSKGPKLDRLAIGAPYMDKSNLRRGTRGKNGDVHCAGDVWFVPYETTGRKKKKATAGHSAAYEFPVELPTRAFKLAGLKPGDTVFDPFIGSGSTAVAAARLGLSCIGVDRDPKIIAVAEARWKEERVV